MKTQYIPKLILKIKKKKTPHFHCRGTGLVPGQRATKIPYDVQHGKKKKREREKETKVKKKRIQQKMGLLEEDH